MEEWHQKLHNNSSADDVIICEDGYGGTRWRGNRRCGWCVPSHDSNERFNNCLWRTNLDTARVHVFIASFST
ncbi:unnamed protein product [Brassica napus]|uniref:(rape) hypothetical protein n=1 Tax=Brassica napus TaxID=3708 RepID=A0A816IMB7_BRANA|nr:unnamed protein product [Brassica napus]